ncbi:AAA family ATPase [Nocardiopsis dassonvillei]|uniref:nucleotide-binding protein n=1 Tax=Nocardiopsis dassonvillei TaxID=2014 RepID=UPI003F57607D
MRLSIAFANKKPGTGKTTTAVLLAARIHALGHDVLLVDADPAGSALAWSDEVGGFPFKIVGLAAKDAGRRLKDFAGPDTIVVVDLPQAEDHEAIVLSVLCHVDEITVPVAPSTIEIDRTGEIVDTLDRVDAMRPSPARVAVLLNRVVAGARSGKDAREGLAAAEFDVLSAQIPRREAYALAYGVMPEVSDGDPIAQLADEYLRRAGIEVAA